MKFRACTLSACGVLLILAVGAIGGSKSSQDKLRFNASPGFQIGSTYQDLQHNARMARQIVVGGGWVHNIWTYLPGPSTADRAVQYYAWQIGGSGSMFNANVDASVGAGFCAIDYDPTNGGAAVVGYHRVASGGTRFSRDTGIGAGVFSARFTFPAANCQGIVSGTGIEGPYQWPVIATDIDGSGNGVVHAVSSESPPVNSELLSIIYYRSNSGITGVGATCGIWIDSVDNIAATIVADPNSDKVAIVYLVPADYAFTGGVQQHNQDVVYRESVDLGDNWGPVIYVSNYTGADIERAYSDVNAMYTSDGCLHIAWQAAYFDSANGTVSSQAGRLLHWDDCGQCKSLVLDAPQHSPSCDVGSWQKNVSRMSLSECNSGLQKRLYITYTFFGDTTDCTQVGFRNGDLQMQVSSTNGASWGPAINLTNTYTPNSAPGEGASENWSSQAMYVTDSLRIQYILDLDAGRITGTEGTWQNNPVMNMSAPCIEMAPIASLSLSPLAVGYPFHTNPTENHDTVIVLFNSGNSPVNYTRSIEYLNGSGWLDFPSQLPTGSVPAGCVHSAPATMRATGPVPEGLYHARVHFVYDTGSGVDTATLAVDLYNFATLCDPPFPDLRTSCATLHTDKTARVGAQNPMREFRYFTDNSNFLFDGSLILGTAADNMSWSIYKPKPSSCGIPPEVPGLLYGFEIETFDSTSNASYRRISGTGTNRDSTVGYSVDYYAPKHPDSCDFFVAKFRLYKGSNAPTGIISNLTVGFACDWDAPADTGSDNTGGFDAGRQMLYQRGLEFNPIEENYGAVAAFRNDGQSIVGGFIWDNPSHVYPNDDFLPTDLWSRMESLSMGQYTTVGSLDDLSSVLTIYRDASLNGAANDTLKFVVILAAENSGPLTDLKETVDKAIAFVNDHGLGSIVPRNCCLHGDADNSGILNISDVVYLINYIFVGGPAPVSECKGDNNCDCVISISDAVYSIIYIFGGGQPPPQCCPGCIYDW